MSDRYIERCSTLLIIKEMHIKITSHSLEWVISKIKVITSVDHVEKREPLCITGGNVNWSVAMEKSMEVP